MACLSSRFRIAAMLSVAALRVSGQDIAVVQSSAAGDTWTPQPGLTWGADFPSSWDVTVDRSQTFQSMIGFGAAFTDTSAYNYVLLMSPTTQQTYLEAMW